MPLETVAFGEPGCLPDPVRLGVGVGHLEHEPAVVPVLELDHQNALGLMYAPKLLAAPWASRLIAKPAFPYPSSLSRSLASKGVR